MSRLPVFQQAFPAMGTTIDVTLVGRERREAEGAFALAVTLADEWEATFSRFRPDSELSRLNANAGRDIVVTSRLLRCIAAALRAIQETRGLFDPTILPALVALGYDRSFDQIGATGAAVDERRRRGTCVGSRRVGRPSGARQDRPEPDSGTPGVGSARHAVDHARIAVNPGESTVRLAEGVTVDLGGIAKGTYADELAEQLLMWPGGSVSAGGDLRLWGTPPSGDAWIVGVEDPEDASRDIAALEIRSGAVATSSSNRRTWWHDGERVHHLIDPRTGRPASSGVRSVTVVAPLAAMAEVAATALFVGGAGPSQVARLQTPFIVAIAVLDSGEIRTIPGNVSSDPYAADLRAA